MYKLGFSTLRLQQADGLPWRFDCRASHAQNYDFWVDGYAFLNGDPSVTSP